MGIPSPSPRPGANTFVAQERRREAIAHREPISSNRDILVLTLREKGIVPDPGKMEEVLALPYTFKEWLAQQQAREAAVAQRSKMEEAA